MLRLSNCDRAWYRDAAFGALDALDKPKGFIFGGDWNIARLFDRVYPDGFECPGPTGVEFFDRAAQAGWVESVRACFVEEVRTYLKPGTWPYQLDHVFTDSGLHGSLSRCAVKSGHPVLSDHAALVIDFDLEDNLAPSPGADPGPLGVG